MKKLFVCLLLGLVVTVVQAAKTEDFVAQLIAGLPQTEQKETPDFECVTVSPQMMEKVVEMMQNNEIKDDEQLQNALKHVKSMRIFSAKRRGTYYYDETLKLLGKNAKNYKPFSADKKTEKKPCVWLRKDGRRVIEMVVLNHSDDENFQVINLTGDMSREFVDELFRIFKQNTFQTL